MKRPVKRAEKSSISTEKFANNSDEKLSIKDIFSFIVNPTGVLQQKMDAIPWIFSYTISGVAFTLFFLQTGLDLLRTGSTSGGKVMLLVVKGLIFGTLGVCIIATFAWLFSKLLGGKWGIEKTLKTFALAYSPTLIYSVFGILANILLGWNTALVFGVTGLLWSIGPMNAIFKNMFQEGNGKAIIMSSLCGVITLILWNYLIMS